MRIPTRAVAGVIATLATAMLSAGSASSVEPLPMLPGTTLKGPTHLRLVVANVPPYVLDVDAHTVRRVRGIEHASYGSVMPIKGGALAVMERLCGSCRAPVRGFVVGPDGSARPLAGGRSVAAARSTVAVWVLDRDRRQRCTVRLVPGGRARVPVPCGTLGGDTDAGLLLWVNGGTVLVDRETGSVRARSVGEGAEVVPLRGDLVLDHGADGKIALADLVSGERRVLRWPSILGGLDQVLAQPHGPLVAIGFADPAYPGPAQAEDLFLLDTNTGRFTHVPGFPAQIRLKFSSMAWTRDDRLVMLFRAADTTKIGVYRPGDRAVALRRVRLPAPNGGSDSFVPIVTG